MSACPNGNRTLTNTDLVPNVSPRSKQLAHAKSSIRQHILRPNMHRSSLRRERASTRRDLKSPHPFAPIAPPQPPMQEDLQRTFNQVIARSPDFLDMEFGQAIVLQMPALQAYVSSKSSFVDEALRKYCSNVGLRRLPPYTPADIIRYQHPELANQFSDFKLPVVWMNDMSAPGVDATRPASHGFAWVFSLNCADLDRLGPFHLVNDPGNEDAWGQRRWQYCGKYYAHRTGRFMSVDGWRRLPQNTRAAAISIHARCLSSAARTSNDIYARFDSGVRCELVILQFCGLPGADFYTKLNEAVALCLRPVKPPTPVKKRPNVEELTRDDPQFAEWYRSIEARKSTRFPA